MNEMKYSKERRTDILSKGIIDGFNYAIVSYGVHPCAYIALPRTHEFYGKEFDIDLDCHCGITFNRDDLPFNPIVRDDLFWIGWDYAHCGDYCGYYEDNLDHKKWTTAEILKEVKQAIKQINI